ncbi:protein Cms1p [Trichomonascus vanleenenianus]|uniref:Cms1p n=1 Tax=Trichomonascus vanleenenianus TaxID=2268995 RepID=UPI003EC97667
MAKVIDTAVDDLDDGLDYSFDLSGEEDVSHLPTEAELKEQSDESDVEVEEKSKKRKKKSDKLVQKKKLKSESLEKQQKEIAFYTPSMIADYIANKIRKQNKDLSTLEINERSIDQTAFVDTAGFKKERVLDNYQEFILKYCNKTIEDENLVLVLAISAIRACDITRALKKLPGGSIKLIKKNGLEYDKKALNGKSRVACSTAGRVNKLIKEKILDKNRIGAIIIDCSNLDPKARTVWDLEDTVPTLKELTSAEQSPNIYMY